MAFKEVSDLSTDTTVAIGGVNRKTGAKNPTSIEGYYLGNRQVESKKSKSGFAYIWVLQTSKGNVGVWGKTDLDRKMQAAPLGAMIRIAHSGMAQTPNGEMYKFTVQYDPDNTIEVEVGSSSSAPGNDFSPSSNENSYNEDSDEDEDAQQAMALAAAERKAKVEALLKGKGKKLA